MNDQPVQILIIDDEPSICAGCRLSLAERGWQADCRESAGAGLKAALEGGYEAVLLDLKLPDIDGMTVLSTLVEAAPDLPILIMTGYSTVDSAVEAMKNGAFDYLAKPFSSDQLLLALDKALETRRLREENRLLRTQLFERFNYGAIVGEDPAILELFACIEKVAGTDSTVLLTGESGTGKELFAGAIHARSGRNASQFVALDCSTLSSGLLESELFGHLKGAFTGAVANKPGIFAIADRGTLFLDEVSNLSLETQGKLLRVMETGEYKPVGASHSKRCTVRVIAATNRELEAMVAEGSFREDLYYRLNVFPLRIPPLRERRDDIPRLAYHFLRYYCRKTGKQLDGFSDEALALLSEHPWPGNVRQLKNAIERLVIMADRPCLGRENLREFGPMRDPLPEPVPQSLEELKGLKKMLLEERFGRLERRFLNHALEACGGNITRAAARVGMQRSNFSALMKKHGLSAAARNSAAQPKVPELP